MKTLIVRHPVPSYYVLTFIISWGSFLIAVGLGPGGFAATPEQLQAMVPYLVPAMLLGPGLVSILLTGLVDGRAGLRAFRSRLLKWRVGARWYAVALLTAPLVFAAVYIPLSLISPEFLPRIVTASNKTSVLLMGVAVGLAAGIFEELGWTGFAIPRMRLHYKVLTTGLVVGVLWAAWHLLQGYYASGVTSGKLSLALWLVDAVIGTLAGQLVAYRVLMVWVYEHTESLLLAMLMHASLSAFTFIFFDPAAGMANLVSAYTSTALLWIVVVAVAVANHGYLSRQPLMSR